MEVVFEHEARKVIVFYRKASSSSQKVYTGCQVLLKKDLTENIHRFAIRNSKHIQKFDVDGSFTVTSPSLVPSVISPKAPWTQNTWLAHRRGFVHYSWPGAPLLRKGGHWTNWSPFCPWQRPQVMVRVTEGHSVRETLKKWFFFWRRWW